MIGRLRAWLGRARAVPAAPPQPELPPPPSFRDELAASGLTAAAWVSSRAREGALYSSLSESSLSGLATAHPDLVAATIAAAERALRHEFDLLGSGPFVPVDPGRPARGAYQPIDWSLDPVTRLRFPERVPHKEWNLLEMRPGLADVKFPWEMGRCQHWLPLAQAFRFSADARFAVEVLDQHDDFMEANPVGLGVNWTCTMDVAIRAFNWAMALDLIQAPRTLDAARLERVYASIFDHGHFIERNLENKYEVTSNHFLSNVVGLFGMAMLFRGLPPADRWRARCREWLEQEMRVQVLPDGADYESSVPYHRLVAELFLSGARLAQIDGAPLSKEYLSTMRAMAEFLHAVLRPDGRVPQVGDADDGRVHVFSNYGRWEPQDARHLLAPASVMFDAPQWWRADDPWAAWEAAWWGLPSVARASVAPAPIARLFPDAGMAVVRRAGQYLLITNAKVGTNGFGNHKHNDLLSFEFHDRGQPLIVDPGSYVYTSDPGARNRFRSTASHNTVVVDDEEQNEFKSEWLFRMFEKAVPEHVEFTVTDHRVCYRGRHNGYTHLPNPVMHHRSFTLDQTDGSLAIDDVLTGTGEHAVSWQFRCAPGVTARAVDNNVVLSAGEKQWRLVVDRAMTVAITDGWYSPSYGVRVPAASLTYTTRANVATDLAVRFALERLS